MLPLVGPPQLASWDRAGHPNQVRLARFLSEVEALAAPFLAAGQRPLALELVVGVEPGVPLDAGGRDLDNYLFPVVQRLGADRFAAVFGRKVRSGSWLVIGPAEPIEAPPPLFAARLAGSYVRPEWKMALRDRIIGAGLPPAPIGPLTVEVGIGTGPGRNWANVWKPLIDSLGPVLGEAPGQPFHPCDDRITNLSFHHHIDDRLGHDVDVALWWAPAGGEKAVDKLELPSTPGATPP